MSVIVEFTLQSPKFVLHETLTSVPDARIEIESLDGLDPFRPAAVMWVNGDSLAAFDDAIRDDETVEDLRLLDEPQERRLYRFQFTTTVDVVIYPVLLDLGASLLSLGGQNGEWTARIRFPDRDALSEFRDFCTNREVTFRLERVYNEPDERDDPLTDRQREALAVAYEVGYFDVPRGESLATVADELDISEQAASERLRRATYHLAARAVENQ